MELLKNFLAVSILFITVSVSAQTMQEKLQAAFKSSYANEKNGEYSKAIKDLKDVYNENSYEINLRLGWLNYAAGNFTESMTYYQKAIQLQPMSEEAKMGYVLPASSVGNWDSVLKQYLDILKINSYNTTVLYKVGLIYYGKAQYSQALPYFEKVVNLYPFSYDGLLMYAWTNLKLTKYNEAKLLFNKVLLLSPTDASAKEGLSLIK